MGRSPSASVESHSREDLDIMLRFVIVLSLAIMVHGAPSGGHTGYGYQTQHCQTKYHTKYEQECHTEYDVVVDTTYTQDVPHQTERKVPRQVCTPVEVKVPYQVCANSHVAVSQYHNTGYGHVYAHH